MGRILLSNSASEHLIAFLRKKENILRELGFRIVENDRPARADELYVGSRIELESSLIRNIGSMIACIHLEPGMEEDFLTALAKLKPFISSERLYRDIWLKAEEVAGHIYLTCPFCGEKLEYAIFRSGGIFPDACTCGVSVAIDITDGSNFSVLEVVDLGVRNKKVKAGTVEYAAVELKDLSPELRETLTMLLYNPENELHAKKTEKLELCAVFYREHLKMESLLITESASPMVVRKIRAVFNAIKRSYTVLVNNQIAEEPSQIIPGAKIEIASELFIPHEHNSVILPVRYDDLSPEDPIWLLCPLLNIETTTDGFTMLKKTELHEETIKCPFCGEEETYLFSSENEKVYPSACSCGAAVSVTELSYLPGTSEEDFTRTLTRFSEKIIEAGTISPADIVIYHQLKTGYIVGKEVIHGREWVKVKKLVERVRDLPYPCIYSMEVPETMWLTDMDGYCWIAFEKEDIAFEKEDEDDEEDEDYGDDGDYGDYEDYEPVI